MRIIAGDAKGRRLKAPPGQRTRPTTDRVKEAIFSMIQFEVNQSKVLDAFAGSGALGIECLSRGAHCATFVDEDWRSISVIKQNLADSKLANRHFQILTKSYHTAFKILSDHGQIFDIIFLDPPYGKGLIVPSLELIAEYHLIASDGCVVVESNETLSEIADLPFIYDREKRYGQTYISLLRRKN